jgi:uncharacterized membrane protein
MADDATLTVFVGRYGAVDDAAADYDTIMESRETRFRTTFDAAVVEHEGDGTVRVIRHHETPAEVGAGVGALVGGMLSIFFPPMLIAMAAGAGIGAIVGHLARGMSREDIKDVGEALDRSDAAVVVVVATTHASEVRIRMTGAEELTEREIAANADEIEKALDEAAGRAS